MVATPPERTANASSRRCAGVKVGLLGWHADVLVTWPRALLQGSAGPAGSSGAARPFYAEVRTSTRQHSRTRCWKSTFYLRARRAAHQGTRLCARQCPGPSGGRGGSSCTTFPSSSMQPRSPRDRGEDDRDGGLLGRAEGHRVSPRTPQASWIMPTSRSSRELHRPDEQRGWRRPFRGWLSQKAKAHG